VIVQVYDVEHGACALVTADNGKRIMIDCGHSAANDFYPGTYLRAAGIDRLETLYVTNYDEDHVSGIENLYSNVPNIPTIGRNRTVSPSLIRYLKSEDDMGRGIEFLVDSLEQNYGGGTVPIASIDLAGLNIETFANSPSPDINDENNLSMVVVLEYAGTRFLFSGDMETKGWKQLLTNARFREVLSQGIDVYFAAHHGRENGKSDELFALIRPRFVVMSDKKMGFQSQETVPWYRHRCEGGTMLGETTKRHVLTTMRDGNLLFDVRPDGSYLVRKFVPLAARAA
jgi:beta-lactamase superfamily II metal-dependent hydrolase